MQDKFIFGMFAIGCISILQGVAWWCGHNGTVFAFTSLTIGAIAGALLGFTFNIKQSIKEYVNTKTP